MIAGQMTKDGRLGPQTSRALQDVVRRTMLVKRFKEALRSTYPSLSLEHRTRISIQLADIAVQEIREETMSDTYTPTTEEVRDMNDIQFVYVAGAVRLGTRPTVARDEFNAAMAAHDAEVAAKTLEEAADLAEGVECIVLDPVMEKIGKNVGLSIAVGLRARAAEYRKAVQDG